jgi:hypothetical protein
MIHYCSGTGGMFLTSVFAKIMNIPIETKISSIGDCHDFGNGVWAPHQSAIIDHVFDVQTGKLILNHVPGKFLYLSHIITNEFIEQNPDIEVVQIRAKPDDYYDISLLAVKKEWPNHWTQEEYNKWVSPYYPPYSPNNIAESALICKDLIGFLIGKKTADWYQEHEHINYSHYIDFQTVMGIDNKNLAQEVATITGGNVTDEVCKFINEYQQLNKKLYLNLKATS